MNRIRDPIDRHLDALEPEKASAGFTEQVMKRIDDPPTGRYSRSSWTPAWAIAAVAAVAVFALLIRAKPVDLDGSGDRAVQLAELRRQHALLEQELAALRTRAHDTAPVIYLGTVDEVDYVWDLSPLLEQRAGRAVPASSRRSLSPEFTKELP